MSAIIQVERLVKRYKNAEANAVDGISFSVSEGQFFALLGPNGAGKTTTISVLTTTLAPTSGTVTIAGYDIATQSAAVRRNVGIIFQQPSLDLNLTAEENVRLHAILYGLYGFRPTFSLMPREYRDQVTELARVVGIEGDLFKPLRTFSGGMRRKLEIVRSLIHRPRVLFLDEPTTGLDPLSRRSLWEYLRQVRADDSTTVFLTTHYLEEAEEADQVCILNRGAIVSTGTPAQIKAGLLDPYLLIDAANRDALRSELAEKGFPFVEEPPFRIPLHSVTTQQVIKAVDTPLTLIEPHTPTLEEAYLTIIGRQSDG